MSLASVAERRRELYPDRQPACGHRERQRDSRLPGDVENLRVRREAVRLRVPAVEIEGRRAAVDLTDARREVRRARQHQEIEIPEGLHHLARRTGERASRAHVIERAASPGESEAGPSERLELVVRGCAAGSCGEEVDFLGDRGQPDELRRLPHVRRFGKRGARQRMPGARQEASHAPPRPRRSPRSAAPRPAHSSAPRS